MVKKIVKVPYLVYLHIEIETDKEDEQEIIEDAMEFAGLSSYCGNGAMGGKLIGTSEECVTVEPCDDPLEIDDIQIEVCDAE